MDGEAATAATTEALPATGLTAAEVWAALNPADASAAVANIVGWAVIGALLSLLPLVVAVLTRRRPEATPARRRSAIIVSGLFAGGMVASLHWVGTFSLGMSIGPRPSNVA